MKPSDDAPDGLINLHLLTLAESLSKKQAKKSDTPPLSKRLTWVNLSNNEALGTRDDALDGIDAFAALNVGLAALEQLKALVVSHNQITRLPTVFPHFPELNTLVLSNNQLTHLPKTLPASLPGLKKLSISHNLLEDGDSLPDFGVCAQLREVRLAGNKSLARLPEHIQRWGRGVDGGAPGLVLLDASDCGLNEWISIAPLLEQLDERRKGLVNLSLKGNAIAEREDYEEKKSEKGQDSSQAAPAPPSEPTQAVEPPVPTTKMPAKSKAEASSRNKPAARSEGEPSTSTTEAAGSERRKRPLEEADSREKKVRKRSGRGPKKSKAPDNEQARLLARAGPAPGDDEPSDTEPSVPAQSASKNAAREDRERARLLARAGPAPGDDEQARIEARAGPAPDSEDEPASQPGTTRAKKTRRKKKEPRSVELTMDMSAEPETPKAAQKPPPTPEEAPAPNDAPAQDTAWTS
ncbi:hypothetical protein MOBT1_000414 [Malassezia obtusa]|uniref:Uncharacterized protein n=1 Tax=Malassezia obtusa TaxID=76774 RepID=A0AAF0E222_9BASI|nr:hypothetical protein MOBT1_000414 [Malassezia obtusa]